MHGIMGFCWLLLAIGWEAIALSRNALQRSLPELSARWRQVTFERARIGHLLSHLVGRSWSDGQNPWPRQLTC